MPEAKYSVPALTAIDPHIDDYAKHAVDMLIDRIEGYSGPARTFHIGGTCLNSTCSLTIRIGFVDGVCRSMLRRARTSIQLRMV